MVEESGTTVTETVDYQYNSLGELTGLTSGTGELIVEYAYNDLGQLVKDTFANGTYTTYTYDADGDLLDLVNYAANKTVDSSFAYTYDALGQATTMTTVDGEWAYTYDSIGQLATATFTPSSGSSVPAQSLSYQYNAAGDLTQTVVNSVSSTYTSDSLGQYTTVSSSNGTSTNYSYNANGDLISATNPSGTTNYSYNSLNQLVSVTSPTGSWTYEYDALGDVVATIENGQMTQNLVDPTGLGTVVGQYDSLGNLLAGYTYGQGLVSQITPSGSNYYAFDGLGSTVGVTNSSGALVSSYSYLPSGAILSSTGTSTNSEGGLSNPFTFVGQFGVTTNGSGLDAMGARSYDAAIGQFTTEDPLGVSSGETNLYEYAGNSPTNAIDPTGTTPQFFGVSGDVILNGALSISASDNGEADLVSGLGGTALSFAGEGGFSPSGVSTGADLETSGSVGASFLGVTAASSVGLPAGEFEVDGSASVRTNDTPVGSFTTLYGLVSMAHATSFPPQSNHVLLEGLFGEDDDLPQPVKHGPKGGSSSPQASGTQGSTGGQLSGSHGTNGTTTSTGANAATGTTSSDSAPSDGTFTQSGNTQAAGKNGDGGAVGGSGTAGTSGSAGSDGSPGAAGSSGAPGLSGSGTCSSMTTTSSSSSSSPVSSFDPNSKQGPAGYGPLNFVSGSSLTLFPYRINFENSPTATAPAQQVTVTDQLDPSLDLSTFQLTGIGFGDTVLTIPAGTQNYQTTVPMTYNDQTFDVVIDASLDYSTRLLTVTFQSIALDPVTGQPTGLPPSDPLTGFLPPEDGTGRGEGYVTYSISPNPGLTDGTTISNVADISFDDNTVIATDQVNDDDPSKGIDPTEEDTVTIVATPPTSSVTAPTTATSLAIPVSWSGTDVLSTGAAGPGIAYYNIFVSDNGGKTYTEWLQKVAPSTETSAVYEAKADGTYTFYSQAVDYVGNVQETFSYVTTDVAAKPKITWANPAAITYGTALGSAQLDATASVPGKFSYMPAAGTVLGAGQDQPLTLVFTPTDSADYSTVSFGVQITVAPAPLLITAVDAAKVAGQPNPPFSVQYSGFVRGQGPSVLRGTLSFTTTATTASGAWRLSDHPQRAVGDELRDHLWGRHARRDGVHCDGASRHRHGAAVADRES